MKINLNQPILQLDGTEFSDKPTLKIICFLAVTTPLKTDEALAAAEKLRLYRLAQKIAADSVADFDAEDIALLKDRICKVIAHVVVLGRAFDMLEGRDMKPQAVFDAAVDARDMPSGARMVRVGGVM